MRRRLTSLSLSIAIIALGCQASPTPRPTIDASTDPAASASAVDATVVAVTPSSEPPPSSPLAEASSAIDEDVWSAMVQRLLDELGPALASQYDGVERRVLDRWFTAEGLASALEQDWRLRAAERGELVIDGRVQVRARTTILEDRAADPPRVDLEIGFVVEAPSSLIDPRTGSIVEWFDGPRYFGVTYALRYDAEVDGFRIVAVAPHGGQIPVRPSTVDAPTRCPGLDPEAPSSHPVASIVWCFGGDDGTLAPIQVVGSWERVPCGSTSARVLVTGWPIGTPRDVGAEVTFVRDPDREFDRIWPLDEPWEADAELPDDAFSTGLTDGEYEVWVSPSAGDAAVWVAVDDRFERWPRAGAWGVTDCN